MAKFSFHYLFLLLTLFCGCSPTLYGPLERLEPGQFPVFHDDLDRVSLQTAVTRSAAVLQKKEAGELLSFGGQRIAGARVRDSLAAFLAVLEKGGDIQSALRREFDVYRVALPVLFTGYHEPLLHGSRVRTKRFRYPIYRPPDDLVEIAAASSPGGERQFGRVMNGQLFPYFSREEIDGKGVLRGKRYELFWVDDPVSLFLLHVQGSGQIRLPDGTRVGVGYAASNGRPYRSIGKILLDQGKLAPGEATTPAIRRYLQTHPAEQQDLFFANPRYVFFQETPPTGPRGSFGAPLTAGRSLAVDPRIYPLGALGFVRTRRPIVGARGQVSWKDFSRFVLLQDAGAAITGWRRADLFWGAEAEAEAGLMAQEGEMYLIVKKP
ncbi:MAG TPA: MltA domain-containing protein [Methylomirabilota bacterium]|jgi:membrane-bound lytic murein transglycosylase A|nr:MltA domain-containing protein [Methylomirabilota bacterium]